MSVNGCSSQNQTAGRLGASLVTSLSLMPWWWLVPTAGYTQASVEKSFGRRRDTSVGLGIYQHWSETVLQFTFIGFWRKVFQERWWLARSGGILCRRGKEVRCRWFLEDLKGSINAKKSHKAIVRCRRFSYLDSEGGVAVTGAPKILAFFGGFDLQKSMCTTNSKN